MGPASSESRAKPLVLRAGRSEAPAAAPLQRETAEVVPYDHSSFLDKTGPLQFVVTNVFTQERARLPPGEWSIEYDEDRLSAALIAEPTDEHPDGQVVLVDDLLKKGVFQHDSGELFVQAEGSAAKSLDSLRTRHSMAEVRVVAGASSAAFSLKAAVFHMPRAAKQSLFWEMSQFFGVFCMTSHKGQRSVWVAKCKPRWERFLSVAGLCIAVQSSHGNAKNKAEEHDSVRWPDRCLQNYSLATVSLLLVLLRWAYASREVGGLEDKRSKKAAVECFEAFLAPIVQSTEVTEVRVLLVASWSCSWPRPEPFCERSFVIKVGPGDLIDLAGLHFEAVGDSHSRLARAWWNDIKRKLHDRAPISCSLLGFLSQVGGSSVVAPLLSQLVWHLSLVLERHFGSHVSGKSGGQAVEAVTMRWKDRAEVFQENLDSYLAQYTIASVETCAGFECLTVATDKASVNGLSLQSSLVVPGSGVGIVCIPQVVFCVAVRQRGGSLGKPCVVLEGRSLLFGFVLERGWS